MKIYCENNKLHISVKDTGMGMTKKDVNKIFEQFHRGINVESINGSGLGMAIVKTYVDLYKGEISVKSELNKGTSVVVVVIPLVG